MELSVLKKLLTCSYASLTDNTRYVTDLPTHNISVINQNYYRSHKESRLVHVTNKQAPVCHRCEGKVPNNIEPRSWLASRHVSALFLLQCSLNPSAGARIVPSATGRAPTLWPWQTSKLENRISIDFPPNVRSSNPKQGKDLPKYSNMRK